MRTNSWPTPPIFRLLATVLILCFSCVSLLHADMPFVLGNGLLENFAALRHNTSGDFLWVPYNGIGTGDQVGSITNGVYQLKGFTAASDGYGVYLQFLPYPYIAPNGFAQTWVLSGTTDVNANRLRFLMKCDHTMPRDSSGSDTMNVGTYVKPRTDTDQSNQGMHYYHGSDANIYAGRWTLFEYNRHPQHRVGAPGGTDYPDDPEWVNPSSTPVHYFNGLTRFYIALFGQNSVGTTCQFDDVYFDTVTGAPDTLVSSIAATHSGSSYEVAWAGPKNVDQQYAIRYSTRSMKVNGFTSGTDAGVVANPGNDYTSTFWKSPPMAEQAAFYVAIQPQGQSAFTEVYIPALNSSAAPANPCDINGDGVVNATDVPLAVNAALGKAACTADLDGNGRCDIVDGQRVINASQGSACRVGQ